MPSCSKKQVPSFRIKFTEREDLIIRKLVEEKEVSSWDEIAKQVGNRTPKQCKDRYKDYLSPGIKNGAWSLEEDSKLKSLVKELGYRWTKIASFFPSRGSNNIKNRWHKVLKKIYVESSATVIDKTPSIPEKQIEVECDFNCELVCYDDDYRPLMDYNEDDVELF